jgi:hypothetical protein
MLPDLARLCRLYGLASFATLAETRTFLGEIWRETDSLLEGDGFEPSVPRQILQRALTMFAPDSTLEGDGFEPSIVAREPVYIAEVNWGYRPGSQKNSAGTDGSNPSPSSGEGVQWSALLRSRLSGFRRSDGHSQHRGEIGKPAR